MRSKKNRLFELYDKSYKKHKKHQRRKAKEEDAEVPAVPATTNPNQTAVPSNVQASTLAAQTAINDNEKDNQEKDDAIFEYILQQLEKHKNDQYKYDSSEAVIRQQQADDIIKDIQNYIKNNTKTQS